MTVTPGINAVFGRMGDAEAHTLPRFLELEGYAGLRKALSLTPEGVHEAVTTSTLSGRWRKDCQ